MQAPKQQRLEAYLQSAKDLAPLSAHAQRLRELQRVYETVAPGYLVLASQVTNYKQGKLHIRAASGAVAAKLKQMQPTLVGGFLTSGVEVTELRIKVQPRGPAAAARSPRRIKPTLGLASKRSLAALIAKLPPDDPLRAALERLLRLDGADDGGQDPLEK